MRASVSTVRSEAPDLIGAVVRELDLERAGCWSHLRTYFHKARHHHPTEAHLALSTLHDLLMIERDIWGMPPDIVRTERQQRSQHLVDGFFEWAKALSQVTRPKSILGDALKYAINQEPYLRVFLENGEAPVHNNLSELMLRQTVVGRKNWLFARSEGGAHASATLGTGPRRKGTRQLSPGARWRALETAIRSVRAWYARHREGACDHY